MDGPPKRPLSPSSLGIITGLLYGLFSALGMITVMVTEGVHPLTHLLFRSLTTISVYTVIFAYNGKFTMEYLFPRGERIFLLVAVAGSAFGTVSFFTALQFLSAADVAAILNSAPVFVTVGAYLLLGERFGVFQGVSAILMVTGVLFICKPSFVFGQKATQLQSPLSWLGILLAIAACILLAISSISCRKLKKTKTLYLVFYMNVLIFILSLISRAFLKDLTLPSCGSGSFWFVAGALFYLTGMAFFFYSSTLMNSGRMSIFRGSSILFAYVLQVIMLRLVPTWHTIVGAIFMMLAPFLATADDLCKKPSDPDENQRRKISEELAKKRTAVVIDVGANQNVRTRNDGKNSPEVFALIESNTGISRRT